MEPMRDVITGYLSGLACVNRSPKTRRLYRYALEKFVSFCVAERVTRLCDVTPEHLEAFRLRRLSGGYAPATEEAVMRAVRRFFAWLEKTGAVFSNPCRDLIITRPERKLLYVPDEEEIARLLEQPDAESPVGLRDQALLETAYSTGARLAELSALNRSDADLANGLLRLSGKGGKTRMVPLGRESVTRIKTYLREGRPALLKGRTSEALWINQRSARLEGPGIEDLVKKYAHQSGIPSPLTPHGLRRACATHLLQHGAHPAHIQLLLGHATLDTLGQYLRLTVTDLKKMHAASRPGK